MKSNLIPTNEYYHRIIDTPDAARRKELYLELFVAPWRQMMDAPGATLAPDAGSDPLAGARAWAWLLPGLVAHEMHHLIRLRLFPWDMTNTTVADCIVHEGLAESFAVSLFGEDVLGPYVTEFDDGEREEARRLIGQGLQHTGFNTIRAYIFGEYWAQKLSLPNVGMPTYGGYAIGYHVVQAYLQLTGATIEEATFVPAADVVEQSGFF